MISFCCPSRGRPKLAKRLVETATQTQKGNTEFLFYLNKDDEALEEYKDLLDEKHYTIGPNQLSQYGMVVPKFIEAALDDDDILVHGDGSQSRSFTWVDDVVNYLIKLAEIKAYGEIFNIGQTEEITIKDLAELVISKTNSNSKIIYKSHEEVFGKAFEDPERRTPGIDKIVEFTGMKPTKNIDFMVENIIDFKKNS